jgi:hypothetical protein
MFKTMLVAIICLSFTVLFLIVYAIILAVKMNRDAKYLSDQQFHTFDDLQKRNGRLAKRLMSIEKYLNIEYTEPYQTEATHHLKNN